MSFGRGIINGDAEKAKSKDYPNVRYAYRANPMGNCNLYNAEGLPALPFTTETLG